MSFIPSLWGSSTPARADHDPFQAFRAEMNRLFENFGRPLATADGPGEAAGAWLAPRIDVRETDDAVTVSAELPGVAQDDLEVTLVDDLLTIKGEKRAETAKEGEEHRYRLVERSYGAFRRSLALPFKADPSAVKASFEGGVLSVTVPKPAEVEAKTQRIPIAKG